MARDGSGTYNRPVSDYTFDTVISETSVNAEMDGMATALSQSIAVDGQTTITANLPMATFRHTGVGNASARTDYAAAGQVQDGDFVWCGTATGTADAATLTPTPAITAYATGQKFRWKASSSANTGAMTFTISGLTTIAGEINDTALAAGEHAANKYYEGLYDGTALQIQRISAAVTLGDLLASNNLSDVANAATARTNLGVGTGDTLTLAGLIFNDETLDQYDVGTYTPTITFTTPGDLSVVYSIQNGNYIRVGDLCVATFYIQTSTFTHTTASGNFRLASLPFTSATITNPQWSAPLTWAGITKANYTDVNATVASNVTYAELQISGSAQANDIVDEADMPTAGNVRMRGSVIYRVA